MAANEKDDMQMKDLASAQSNVSSNVSSVKGSDGETEKSSLIDAPKLSPKTAARLTTAAKVISWISIIFSLATGLAGIVLSISSKSESLFAYGLEASLDSLSSVAVVWRFHGAIDPISSAERERKACIAIGILFVVSAVMLITKSVHAIIVETHETKQIMLYASFALTCGVISAVIAVVKIYIGYKIRSQALYTDSIITIMGAITCFASVGGLELYIEDTDLWFIDSVFGIACGLFLLVFGIRLLHSKLAKKYIQE